MALTTAIFFCLGIFAILHFLAIPRIERQLRAERSAAMIGKAGTLALLGFLRTVALVLGSTSVAILVIVASLDWFTNISLPEAITAAIRRAQGLRDGFQRFSPFWSGFVFTILVLAMWIVSRRNGRLRVEKVYREAVDADVERLRQEREAGNWPNIPPTPQMENLLSRFNQLQGVLDQIDQRAPANEEEKAKLEDLHGKIYQELQNLQILFHQMDVARRIQVEIDPEKIAYPPPRNWKERAQYFLISQGLMGSLRGGTRALFISGFVLLMVAFLGIESRAIGNVLGDRIVELDKLRVAATEKQAIEQWEKSRSGEGDAEPWTDEDEEAANLAASQFETAFTASRQWNPILSRAGISVRSMHVRQEILRRAVASDSTQLLEAHPSFVEAPDLRPLERESLEAYAAEPRAGHPRTEAGRRIYREMREVSQSHPGAWTRIKRSVQAGAASFQHPTTADDLTRMMLTRIVGEAAAGAGESGTAVAEILRNVDEAVGPDALRRAYRIRSSEYLNALASGSPLDEAARLILSEDSQRPLWTEAETTALKATVRDTIPNGGALERNPPTLVTRPEPHVTFEQAVRETDEMRNALVGSARPQAGQEWTNALAEFDDHFPGQLGKRQATDREALLESWRRSAEGGDHIAGLPRPTTEPPPGSPGGGIGGGGGGRDGGRRTGPANASSSRTPARNVASVTRARSFGRLRGFARIGGVLIGNEPSSRGAKLDFRSLRWQEAGGRLRLTVVDARGKEMDIGTFHPAIVRQALAYAADGRPITVTMVEAAPLIELKILLHPALVDTPLGCRAIEIDRFVDVLTGQTRDRGAAESMVHSHIDLYRLAWAHRVKTVVDSETASTLALTDNEIGEAFGILLQQADAILEDPEIAESSALALRQPEALGNSDRSPLTIKKSFFEEALVTDLKACASVGQGKGDVDAFGSCIARMAGGKIYGYLNGPSQSWQIPPPEFQIWSGVRERSFALDPALSFLKRPAGNGTGSALWPFDFMLQVAFTSPPLDAQSEEEAEAFVDETPWEFPALAPVISERVAKGIAADPELRSIHETMRDFTVLQRFFRVALAGGLGENFPQERFVQLMDATASSAPRAARTLRWNPRPGHLEIILAQRLQFAEITLEGLLASSEESTVNEYQQALRTMRSCRELIEGTKESAYIPQAQWASRCSFESLAARSALQSGLSEADRLVHGVARFAVYTTRARNIRRELGVRRDDLQALAQSSCPAM